jgi:hypothetical protein
MSIFPLFFLIIGLVAAIKNKPLIINSKWLLAVFEISFAPVVVDVIIASASFKGLSALFKGLPALFFLMLYSLSISLMIAAWFLIKSYSIFCVNDVDIRDAVIYSLKNNSLRFEENINKIHLVDINNDLKISFNSMGEFTGMGLISMKNKKDKMLFKKIINDIKLYIKQNDVKANKKAVVFQLMYGIILGLMCVFSGIFIMNLGRI